MGFLRSELLSSIPGIVHGFGDSAAAGDPGEIAAEFGLRGIYRLKQVHGNRVIFADEIRAAGEDVAEGDALLTAVRGFGAAVSTADCVPILLTDGGGEIAAAIHAGWRGTLSEITVEAVRQIERKYGIPPSGIYAAIGPSIKKGCYEVGEDVAGLFLAKFGEGGGYIERKDGSKYMLDLPLANMLALEREGVEKVDVLQPCTRCDTHYHSYRRHGKGVGSQLSFIGLV